jgi:sigma-B regulation protein RsbU (phosphoserine phosphatase)
VLATVFARGDEEFYDDVLLVDRAGDLIGLIATQTLFKVQNALLRGNILELQTKEREIRMRNDQMETDLRMAMELQQALLPKEYPLFPSTVTAQSARLRFAHLYRPASLVGGDFFHVVRISDHEAGIFICDVMGHGVRAALVASTVSALVGQLRDYLGDPGELLARLNRALCSTLEYSEDGLFASAFYLLADLEKGELHYANAGHPNPLRVHCTRDRADTYPLNGSKHGPALGAQAGERRLREVIVDGGGFKRLRRATQTPFNLILEAKL